MKIPLLLLTFLFAGQSSASLLTFEDIPGGSIQNKFGDMPTYKGFKFSSALDWIDLVDPPLSFGNRGTYSGDFAIFNNNQVFSSLPTSTGIITEENGSDFTFDGLWAKKWYSRKNSGGVDSLFGSIDGYNNGVLTWSMPAGLNGSYEYYGAQVGIIDELRIDFGKRGVYLIDDLSLTAVSPVPEPSSIVLMLGGLGLVGFMIARRATKINITSLS